MNILKGTTAVKETVQFDGHNHEASALALAQTIGHALDNDLAVLAKAKADYEGGPFVVMFNLFSRLTAEQQAAIPDHETETGNNPRFYKTKVMKEDGKEKVTDRDYYKVMAHGLPDVIAKKARIELLGRSMKDPTTFNLADIPQDIKDMPLHRRHAEMTKLASAISTAEKNVVSAMELRSQIERFNGLSGVSFGLLYKLDDKGAELDGSNGVMPVIDDTKRPIIITTKLERRMSIDTNRFSVSSFMRFNVPKAIEQGGSWDALLATVKKEKKEKDKNGADNAKLIRTPDTASQTMTDFADYLTFCQDDRTKAAWEAFTKSLHGAGSDDAFMNACLIQQALTLAVGDPKSQVRYQKLFSDRDQAAA
jgi:hypothetical protein